MTNKCKHNNVVMYETWKYPQIHFFENGNYSTHHDEGDPTGDWDIKCNDCQREWHVNRFKKIPKWIKMRIEAANDALFDGDKYDESIFKSEKRFKEFMQS